MIDTEGPGRSEAQVNLRAYELERKSKRVKSVLYLKWLERAIRAFNIESIIIIKTILIKTMIYFISIQAI